MIFILLYIKFLATHIHSAVLDSLQECTFIGTCVSQKKSLGHMWEITIAVQNRIAIKKGGCNIKTLQVPLSRFCK